MNDVKHRLVEWADSRGWLVGWAGIGVLRAALAEIKTRRRSGEVPEAFAHDNLSFDGGDGQAQRDDGTWRVLVIVTPRSACRIGFLPGGRRFDALLPPTYDRYRPIFEDVRKELEQDVLPGARVETLDAPLKLLAASLGLVRYGRTNVTYAPAIGSYLQVLGYLTDADLPAEAAREPREPTLLDECEGCGVCEAVCPTGAISGDRVLLRSERCLPAANEVAGEWPGWVPPGAHNCLIGCLLCQRACPANPDMRIADSGIVFDQEETDAMLGGGERSGAAWDRIRIKLGRLGREYDEDVIGRNLRALMAATR